MALTLTANSTAPSTALTASLRPATPAPSPLSTVSANGSQPPASGKPALPPPVPWQPRQPQRDNSAYFAMIGRMLRSGASRVGSGDYDELSYLLELRAASEDLITLGIHALHYEHGLAWARIAEVTGTTKQAVLMRYHCPNGPGRHPHGLGCIGPVLVPGVRQCAETAASTGVQCKAFTVPGYRTCRSHMSREQAAARRKEITR